MFRSFSYSGTYICLGEQSACPDYYIVQSNLDGSNTDGSFTMANSNSFLSPYEILPIAQKKKQIFKDFFLFYREIVCCVYSLESPHRGDSNEYTQHTRDVRNELLISIWRLQISSKPKSTHFMPSKYSPWLEMQSFSRCIHFLKASRYADLGTVIRY